MKRHLLVLVSVLLISFAPSLLVSGQNPLNPASQETTSTADSIVAPILPYAISEISLEANNTISLANKMGSNRMSEEEIETFKSEIDSFLIPIDTFLFDTTYLNLGKFTNWDLDKTENRINLYLGQVTLKESSMSKRYMVLEDAYSTLAATRKRWQITKNLEGLNEVQATLAGRVDMSIRAIDSVSAFLQSDMENLLLHTDRLLDRHNKLTTLKNDIQSALLVLSQSMFKKDNRALFRDLSQLKQPHLLKDHVQVVKGSIQGDVEIFRSEFPHVIRAAIILFIVLISLLTWFSYNYKSVISQNKINLKEVQRNLIRSPVLVGIFSTFIIIFFSYPELPFTFGLIILLILSAPIAILAIRFLGKGVEYLVIWAVLAYTLSLIYRLSFAPDVLQRIFLLGLSVFGLAMYGWMLVNKAVHQLFKNAARQKTERSVSFVFLLMMFAAIVANFAGFFSLAAFLTMVPFQITFLLVVVKVLASFVKFIFYIGLASNSLLRVNAISDFYFTIYKKLSRFVNLFFVIFFFTRMLRILRVKEVFLAWWEKMLTTKKMIGQAEISLESILVFVFVIWLSLFITKIIRYILEKDVFVRVTVSKGIPGTTIMMVRIILIVGGFFLAATAAGMQLTNLSIIIGAFSVGIGFGLQSIFNNMVSGLILAFERPINVGDVVQVGTLTGTVKNIGLRASKVKSFDGAEVIVPNGMLISDQLINWTLSDSNRRMDIRIGVAYGTDPNVVLGIIREVAATHKVVSKDPAPSAYFVGFGDSSLDFRLLAWVDIDNRLSVESEIYVSINDKIKEAGIEIPFPQSDLHIRSDDTKAD